jgi:anti-sigma factor RsiW
MIRQWRCRQLAAALVDYADGVLASPQRERVERHLAQCARCAAAVASLREAPALLRHDSAEANDAFWTAQRERIMQQIDTPPPRAREPQRGFDWRLALPVAAAAVIALAGYLSLRPPSVPGAVVLDTLSPDDLVALVEVAGSIVPAQDMLPDSALTPQAALDGALDAGWIRTDDAGWDDDTDPQELRGTPGLVSPPA